MRIVIKWSSKIERQNSNIAYLFKLELQWRQVPPSSSWETGKVAPLHCCFPLVVKALTKTWIIVTIIKENVPDKHTNSYFINIDILTIYYVTFLRFVPAQRWLHNIEHGAVVMLYHPCTHPETVAALRRLVTCCIRKHIITPSTNLSEKRPLALVAWGCRMTMSHINSQVRFFCDDQC